MKCAACGKELENVEVGDIVVDVCRNGCGGMWFDNFELEKVDEKKEAAGEILLTIERDPEVRVDHTQKRKCPKCDDQTMMRHFMSVKREVELDECPSCGGFWLDYGELGKIREQFETEADRKQAADAYFEEVFGDELAKMREESDEKLKKARKIARMFRFICPSYYIPGKQEWGAF